MGTVEQWNSGTVEQWNSGTVEQWNSGTVEQWNSGTVEQWNSGTVEQWNSGTVEQWNSGTVEQWNSGTVEQWNSGTVEQWNSGTVEQWNSGTVEQWNSGTALLLFLWLFPPACKQCNNKKPVKIKGRGPRPGFAPTRPRNRKKGVRCSISLKHFSFQIIIITTLLYSDKVKALQVEYQAIVDINTIATQGKKMNKEELELDPEITQLLHDDNERKIMEVSSSPPSPPLPFPSLSPPAPFWVLNLFEVLYSFECR